MKERWKGKESQEAKRKERSKERGETWEGVKMKCVFRIVKNALLATIQTCPPKNFLAPLWPPHSKKLAPPLIKIAFTIL